MSTSPADPRRIAENSLWHALEERREQVRRAGLKYSPRQYVKLRQAHDEWQLIAQLCGPLENYTGNSDPRYLEAMALMIKRGLETWEHVLIRRDSPWERYVTKAAGYGAAVHRRRTVLRTAGMTGSGRVSGRAVRLG